MNRHLASAKIRTTAIRSQYVCPYTSNMADHYKAYLLRFQRGEGQDHWRATLVDALSGEKKRFASERALFANLMQILAKAAQPLEEFGENSHEQD